MEAERNLALFRKVGELKNIKRAGWVRAGIPNCESVADHSFRCIFLAMMLGNDLDLNSEKLLKMAVVHDIAECVVGDITPYDGISKDEKKEKELMALKELFTDIPRAKQYMDIWTEYEAQISPEAKIIKNIDKLEMVLTAFEYQNKNPSIDLAEFVDEAETCIDDPTIKQIFQKLKMQGTTTSQ